MSRIGIWQGNMGNFKMFRDSLSINQLRENKKELKFIFNCKIRFHRHFLPEWDVLRPHDIVDDFRGFRIADIAWLVCVSLGLDCHWVERKCAQIPRFKVGTPVQVWMLAVHDGQEFIQCQQMVKGPRSQQLPGPFQGDGIAQCPVAVAHCAQVAVP